MTDKNDFKMPFLRTTDFAADKIYKGLVNSNKFEIHFTIQLTLILKLLRILPYSLYLKIISILTKYQKN